MHTTPLFRAAALDAKRPRALGEIILTGPISFRVLTAAAVAATGAIVGFFIWGSYTTHSTLTGQLVPDRGIIQVHAPQYGTIVEKHVGEGDVVNRGDVLYVVSSERLNSDLGATQELIGIEVTKRLQSLGAQIDKLGALAQMEETALERMASALRSEAANLSAMAEGQADRVDLAEQTAARYERLRQQGFVSEEQAVAKREDLLEQRSRWQGLKREHSNLSRQLTELENQIRGLPLKYQNETAELERAIAGARQELTENEARRRLTIVAPEDGTATAVIGELGQFIDANRVLVSIIPRAARLRADLYAPSRAVGFVSAGDQVLLRYEAYPYQKYGHHRGTVAAVSRTAMPVATLTGMATMGPGTPSEPMYRISVAIDAQAIHAYGKTWPLQANMVVQADVLLETRRLYEWVLEPLYTLTGKIHGTSAAR